MVVNNYDLSEYFQGVAFGDGVQVCGIRGVSIGEGSCIGDDAWLNDCIRDGSIRIKIGRRVLVGRRGTISTAGHLEIGDYTTIEPNVLVSNGDHDYRNVHVPILTSGVSAGRTLIVEENCWLCVNSVITGSLTIGRGSVVGANAVVLKDVPPFSVVVGNPARIVKMYDWAMRDWVRVRSEADERQVLRNATQAGMPSRAQYARILAASGMPPIDPIAAGRGQHIL